MSEIYDRVSTECHRRGYDLDESPMLETYARWATSVSHWGGRSPGATGWLLALVRGAWGRPLAYVWRMDGWWWIQYLADDGMRTNQCLGINDDEPEWLALVVALESAPELEGPVTP